MKRWEQRIDEARERRFLGVVRYPRFTREERDLASNWATCAVGEMRNRYGVRMDRTLGTLGVKFYRAVLWNMVDRASELRESIETYALERKRDEWERQRSAAPAITDSPALVAKEPAA